MDREDSGWFIIDTDGGVDDAMAILLAMSAIRDRIVALSAVHGNVNLEQVLSNLRLTCRIAGGLAPPILRGTDRPLLASVQTATVIHGEDGLGNIRGLLDDQGQRRYIDEEVEPTEIRSNPESSLSQYLIESDQAKMTIICIGPLTNIAIALENDSLSPEKIRQIVFLGGAEAKGNITPHAEFNVFCDPDAARRVFSSGCPLRVIPLHICEQVFLSEASLVGMGKQYPSRVATFLLDSHAPYIRFYQENRGMRGSVPHDSIAVAAALAPEMFDYRRAVIDVETVDKDKRGMTSINYCENGTIDVATSINIPRFEAMIRDMYAFYCLNDD